MTLVLEWAENPPLVLEWAGDDGVTIYEDAKADRAIAAIVGPSGLKGDPGTAQITTTDW